MRVHKMDTCLSKDKKRSQHQDSAISIAYLKFIQMIEDCKTILKVI